MKAYQVILAEMLTGVQGINFAKDLEPMLWFGTCATKSLDRIAQNPLVGESISSHRLNPAWDRFPTPLSVVRPVRS